MNEAQRLKRYVIYNGLFIIVIFKFYKSLLFKKKKKVEISK